jgi:hypothetical protein
MNKTHPHPSMNFLNASQHPSILFPPFCLRVVNPAVRRTAALDPVDPHF